MPKNEQWKTTPWQINDLKHVTLLIFPHCYWNNTSFLNFGLRLLWDTIQFIHTMTTTTPHTDFDLWNKKAKTKLELNLIHFNK